MLLISIYSLANFAILGNRLFQAKNVIFTTIIKTFSHYYRPLFVTFLQRDTARFECLVHLQKMCNTLRKAQRKPSKRSYDWISLKANILVSIQLEAYGKSVSPRRTGEFQWGSAMSRTQKAWGEESSNKMYDFFPVFILLVYITEKRE